MHIPLLKTKSNINNIFLPINASENLKDCKTFLNFIKNHDFADK